MTSSKALGSIGNTVYMSNEIFRAVLQPIEYGLNIISDNISNFHKYIVWLKAKKTFTSYGNTSLDITELSLKMSKEHQYMDRIVCFKPSENYYKYILEQNLLAEANAQDTITDTPSSRGKKRKANVDDAIDAEPVFYE